MRLQSKVGRQVRLLCTKKTLTAIIRGLIQSDDPFCLQFESIVCEIEDDLIYKSGYGILVDAKWLVKAEAKSKHATAYDDTSM